MTIFVLIFDMKKPLIASQILLSLLIIVLISSCTKSTKYAVVGTVKEVQLKEKTVIVRHDSIPGLMMAMTMPFKVLDNKEIQDLSPGDSVHFDFVWQEDPHYAEHFIIVGKGKTLEEDAFWEEEDYQKDLGAKIDDGTFLDEEGKDIHLSDSDGKFRIISFIFSRCPMPNMCPAVVFKNQYLASAFKDNDQVELMMISFDYVYDSPKVLIEKYGPATSGFSNWHVWSSQDHSADMMWLAKQIGFAFWGVEQNQIGHNLRSIILDPDRRWLKTYVGDQWKGKEIKEDLNQMMKIY